MVITLLSEMLSLVGGAEESNPMGRLIATLLTAAIVLFIAAGIYMLLTRVFAPAIQKLVKKTTVTWDDELLNPRVVRVFCKLVISIVLLIMLPDALALYPSWERGLNITLEVVVVVLGIATINQGILAVYNVICDETHLPAQSLKGIRQMIQLIFFIIGAIVVISILINRSPVIVLSGLGASAAVLMLVFRDTILGLVAGVQLTVNDMLKPGDWITVSKYGINGTVIDVTLTTVKVQNFDMTIVTIPPYLLVSETFQNWRGMQDSGGRRITRSLTIDTMTIRRLEGDEVLAFKEETWAKGLPAERMINITLFRRWLENYLQTLSTTSEDMTCMVRELQPTSEGIPVEIYLFTSRQDWVDYEHLQADLVDYIIASLSRFNLRLYQAPSGYDLQMLRSQKLATGV